MMDDQIWLTGFMATGKSRIARPLAAALDWRVVDLDALIEADAGEPLRAIFEHGGEAAFRAIEAHAVEQTAQEDRIVVATGGGSVLSAANREAMHRRGFVVCLDAQPGTILRRIEASGARLSGRPLLAGGDPLARIVELKAAREPLYRQADFILSTDELSPDQCTHQILTAFRERTEVVRTP
ncbi:MAG: shikimate kinase [Dehalococcoidia bacterium]|nr:shikimate kinase [Dehalococcoidia bacterium]